MARILAFIENDMYLRNFVTSGAFELLLEEPEFKVYLSEIAVKLAGALPPERVGGRYQRSELNRALTFQFNKVSMRALRDKSSTFDIKTSREIYGPYTPDDVVLGATGDIEALRTYFLGKFENNDSLEAAIQKERPELVIFPVTGVESTGTELNLLARRYGFKTLFLMNGWDNLSSKGVFPLPPDYLGILGPQSLLDAVEIQGVPVWRVILLGCARYEPYFQPGYADRQIFPHRYILFAGSTMPCDEITPLKLMDQVLREAGHEDLKLVYRPHPWREKRNCFDLFRPEDYTHAMLDPQVEADYYKEKQQGTESVSSQNFPDLKYYPSLLNHAQFVISPMSSMTLEAAIFDVPAMVLAHDDGVHAMPPSQIARMRHFEGAEEIPGWFFVRELEQLKPLFAELVERFKDDTPQRRAYRPALSAAIRRYLHHDERSYALRLHEAVAMILAGGRG